MAGGGRKEPVARAVIILTAELIVNSDGEGVVYQARPLQEEERRLMGLISRAIDKIVDPLPRWAKWILGLLVLIGFIYGIVREGFWFILRVLFAPDF
jgi:hypothetical protein